jgi:hypothetical protein
MLLFHALHEELSDDEVAAVLREAMASLGRLPRHADPLLAAICAEHLVVELRTAGLFVVRPIRGHLHE